MEVRTIEISLISARDLKDTNMISKTKAYAVAWINGDPRRTKHRTTSDKQNGLNPNWNQPMSFTVDEGALQQGRLVLEVEIRCEGTFGDKELGRVTVPLKEFATQKSSKAGSGVEFVSYQVRKASGKAKGTLNLSIKLGDKTEVKQQPQYQPDPYQYPAQGSYASNGGAAGKNTDEPVTAYPAYPTPTSSSSSYPPPPSHPGPYPPPPQGPYPPPPQGPYPPPPHAGPYPPPGGNYPPPPPYQQGGYPPYQGYPPYNQGYPPVGPPQQQKPPKKNKMGLGLGAGLLGGALGGLLIGDMIGDASYDNGFDGGFDGGDFGGGDF